MKAFLKLLRAGTVLSFFLLASCQKEICYENFDSKPPITKYAIPGGWQGKFGLNTDPPSLHFAAHFKTDGYATVEADSIPYILLGTWQLTGDSLITNYSFQGTGENFRFAAKFTDTSNRIDGYWRAILPTVGGGTFYLQKY